ncbi:MAG: hypothetical protein K5694_03395 [Bacilli bacterium]|nr:hypothetical protein [Bacilli bacterium]
MNYQELLEYLKQKDLTMLRYDREGWDAFVSKTKLSLGVPFIHVTGTNGKGSTVHYLKEIYKAKGYKVATFTSPYLYDIKEMIKIDDKMISEGDLLRIFNEKEKEIAKYELSTFEIMVYIAYTYFNEVKPDVAIIETGMGGITDATTLYNDKPLLSIITTVALEHTEFLGTTYSEIAYNKAGIIKTNGLALVGEVNDEVFDVIAADCRKKNAKIVRLGYYYHEQYDAPYFRFDYSPYTKLEILSMAYYMIIDASIAVQASLMLNEALPVDENSIRKGLLAKPLEGRLERHHNVYIDGAHNPEAIKALCKSEALMRNGKQLHVIFGSFTDKNIMNELPVLGTNGADITLTSFPHPRARKQEDFGLFAFEYPYEEDYRAAISDCVSKYPDDIVLITGSLAFASLARTYVTEELKL